MYVAAWNPRRCRPDCRRNERRDMARWKSICPRGEWCGTPPCHDISQNQLVSSSLAPYLLPATTGADKHPSLRPLLLSQALPPQSPYLSEIFSLVVILSLLSLTSFLLPPYLPHLLIGITANFFRLIVGSTSVVWLHKVAGQSPHLHQRQCGLRTQGDCNDRISSLVIIFRKRWASHC